MVYLDSFLPSSIGETHPVQSGPHRPRVYPVRRRRILVRGPVHDPSPGREFVQWTRVCQWLHRRHHAIFLSDCPADHRGVPRPDVVTEVRFHADAPHPTVRPRGRPAGPGGWAGPRGGPEHRRLDDAISPVPDRPEPLLRREQRPRELSDHHAQGSHPHQQQPRGERADDPGQHRGPRIQVRRPQDPLDQPCSLGPQCRQRPHQTTDGHPVPGDGRRRGGRRVGREE